MNKKGRGNYWTAEEDEILRRLYSNTPNSEISKLIFRGNKAIEQRARKLGVFKPSRRIKIKPGDKFNKLTAIEFVRKSGCYFYWRFKCDCGKEVVTRHSQIATGRTVSCGCFAREQFDKIHGIPENEGAKRDIFYTYKKNAESRNYSFELKREEFDRITQENCFYCGVVPSQKYRQDRNHRSKDYLYNGIDRFDNKLGYTLENSRPCCTNCNQAKMDMSVEKFIEWLERLVRFQREKIS